MLKVFFLLFFIVASSYADDRAWYTKIDTKVEAAVFLSDYKGTLSNPTSSFDFKDDLHYANTASSFFSIESRFDFPYVPNIYVSYFNIMQENDVDFNRTIEFVGASMSKVTTRMDYKVLNAVLFQEFKKKGSMVSVLGRSMYSGDIEFDIGVNIKIIDYMIQMKDLTKVNAIYMYDRVESTIPLPYAGFKYYRYGLVLFGNMSALSFADAKSTNYQFGVEYQILENISLCYSYMYEDFQATEKRDHIDFKTAGNKFSLMYAF